MSAQYGHADGDYAQVHEQAGLFAGDGGFDVNVKGNTDLKGAVISGAADASRNTLNTGTLTFSDIENHSHYSANSIGGSMGLAPGATTEKSVGTASVPGSGGLVPMIGQHESGDATNAFLNGDGNQAFISIPTPWRFNVIGALTHAYGGSTALEVGIGSAWWHVVWDRALESFNAGWK
ncbi:polymorphic toxin type 22 domain-containing protein [Caballeronia sp. BR00000012568055]|uniref:polymorphic toxin type 22 domain-containing protein n=1 Tax=Caballeronia sp. BR00000012568055 TaxID=2918761 RepID=UPI0023F67EDC|nr:polymorphic toxin type 22 domain-containing protein [Caballeronia sp. BR00000012568055]